MQINITEDMAEVIMGSLTVACKEGVWGIESDVKITNEQLKKFVVAQKKLIFNLQQNFPEIVQKYSLLLDW